MNTKNIRWAENQASYTFVRMFKIKSKWEYVAYLQTGFWMFKGKGKKKNKNPLLRKTQTFYSKIWNTVIYIFTIMNEAQINV
jgi:hypothetical protein